MVAPVGSLKSLKSLRRCREIKKPGYFDFNLVTSCLFGHLQDVKPVFVVSSICNCSEFTGSGHMLRFSPATSPQFRLLSNEKRLQSLLEKPQSKGFFQRARERWANKLPLRAELQPDQDATARLCTFNS